MNLASKDAFKPLRPSNMYQFPKKSFLDRMKVRDGKQTRIRFYAKAKRNNSYSRHGVCDVSNNDAKDEHNKVTKKKYFGDATKSKLKENQNTPDRPVCDQTGNCITNVKVIKQDRLDNGYLVEKEVHGDKIVNYHLDNDGNRILLPGFVYTTKNDLHEDSRTNLYNSDDEEKVFNYCSVSKSSPEIKAASKVYQSLKIRESDTHEWFGPLPSKVAKTTTDFMRAQSDDENGTSLDTEPKSNAINSSTDAGPKSNAKHSSTDANLKKTLTKKEEPSASQVERKASAIAKVGEKRKAEEPQEELMKKRYLNKWVPLLRNKKLYIEGDIINCDSVTPSDMSSKWMTSKIVSRISEKEVGTKKTCYVLEGQLAIPAPGEGPMPLFVMDMFKNGFPENWKNIIQHWIHFNDQSMVTEATNQTILNNISCMTMTMFNSTPMPGMMSNINSSSMSYIPDASRPSSKIPEKSTPSNVTSLEKRDAGNI